MLTVPILEQQKQVPADEQVIVDAFEVKLERQW